MSDRVTYYDGRGTFLSGKEWAVQHAIDTIFDDGAWAPVDHPAPQKPGDHVSTELIDGRGVVVVRRRKVENQMYEVVHTDTPENTRLYWEGSVSDINELEHVAGAVSVTPYAGKAKVVKGDPSCKRTTIALENGGVVTAYLIGYNKAARDREAERGYRERKRAQGLVYVGSWVPEERVEELKEFVEALKG
jgi:hypothetical protein